MKKISLLLALFVVLFGGCTKNYYGVDNDPSYIVQGLTDITTSTDDPVQFLSISLEYQSKEQERVEVSVEGIPAGISYEISNSSGIPSFNSFIQLTDSSAAVGVYDAKLVTTGSLTGKKTFPFKITVKAVPDCATNFTGTFAAQNVCASGPSNFTESITVSPTVQNRIILNNFENSGIQLYANLSCSSQQLTVPSQTINGNTYSGSGFFWNPTPGTQQVRISYTKVFGTGGSTFCTQNMNR